MYTYYDAYQEMGPKEEKGIVKTRVFSRDYTKFYTIELDNGYTVRIEFCKDNNTINCCYWKLDHDDCKEVALNEDYPGQYHVRVSNNESIKLFKLQQTQ